MARNELFGIDVEEKEVKFDEIVEKKEEKSKKGEVKISDKLTFKTGDNAEIKEFLKKVIDTEDYNEELKLIVNEWIEWKIYFYEMPYKEILFAEKYTNSTKVSNEKLLSNNGESIEKKRFLKDKKYKQNLNGIFGQNRGTIKKEDEKISRYRKTPKRLLFNNIELKRNKEILDMIISDTIQIEIKTAEAVNELLNDLLTKVMEVLDIRKENEEAIETFFKTSHV